ncbi:MAG: Ig-like domain-containing protein [Brachybacterium sp.]|uniref:Ig-like domain-containing protein n=1 Tax=Brachybacterium sp. TaxID=1891286 RepID=UPI00264883BA|nr:Ig-like domain-containing protein [Brachybacterium sp.]MDN5685931.1 Ig-like domain-containing protein [Brachybacterium sp.]
MSVTAGVKQRRRRSTVVSSAVLAVVALVVTGFAIHSPGLSSSDVEVSDGGVWVTGSDQRLMGRLNVDAGQLDARLSMSGDDLDILQSGYTVLETGPRGITPINTASVQRGGLVELQEGTQVKLGADRVAIASPDGKIWILTPGEAAAFDAGDLDPTYEADDEAPKIAVSTEGTVFVLDGDQLLKFPRTDDTRDTEADKPITVSNVSTKPEMLQVTTVGEDPVILDKENRLLRIGTDASEYSLSDDGVSDLQAAQLQQPSSASDDVVVATEDTLFLVPLAGGDAQKIAAEGTGEPVAPAQAQGCAYGAWNQSVRYVRICEGGEPVQESIPEADSAAALTFRVNHDLVVLNDQEFGLSWKIAENMEVVEDWNISQDIQTDKSEEKEKETLTTTITNTAAEREEENREPTANDDSFGVRPGASVVLPVTRNDTDPDGDVLTVDLEGDQPGIGTVTPIQGGTQMQVVVDEDASGSASFTYQADDGRGGTDTAGVDLEVHGEDTNEPPKPVDGATTKVQVRSGEDISFTITPYWQDPDGDAFYLTNAVAEPEDVVSFQPDGLITFNDAGIRTGTKTVTVEFRDENGATREGTVEVEAVTDNDLAPITTADHASIVSGRTTTIKPLVNDLNPNGGQLELTNVTGPDALEIDAVLDAGTIRVSGASPGTYYLEYTVAASGASSASLGIIRVDIVEPASDDLIPVAVDDLGTVTTGTDTVIDPLQNDVDPTGGVLVVNSVQVPEDSGLKATIVAHHLVRVEAEPGATVSDEPVPLTYEVANSAGSTEGTIRVMLASTDTQFANPIAVPDRAVVRAGDMVSIDVIGNDVSPTDSEMHLGEILDTSDAESAGHAESHQDQVRFRADDDASGEVTLTYQVMDETGRDGAARVTIQIVPRDASNSPPEPENLEARTVAGSTVRIPVPTSGIDPEGDSVMLTGITSPTPQLGVVESANGEWIEYTPYEDSAGTDRFRYQVMDRYGAIGTAEVLVGVAQPNEMNQPPYAVDDTVEVRPDREIQIPVLENDTDPEGTPLSVVREDVEAMTEIEVADPEDEKIEGVVTATTPSEPGTHTLLYSASDGQLKSSASVTVEVDPDAPLRSPVARDDFVPAEQVMDPEREHIDVDVLANDSDPDGSTSDLKVTLEGNPEGASLRGEDTVRVTPQEEQQRLRYVIEDQDGMTSAGYVWVPGTAKQAPTWVGQPVEVQAGSEVEIDLADPANVRVRPGAENAQITDPSLVTAAHTDGSELVEDETTLRYRPAEDFSGRDSISVEVTDGEVGDSAAATATLAIPVVVAPEEADLPPTLQGAALEVEQGDVQGSVDLAASAEDPEGDELSYSLGEVPEAEGLEVSREGSTVIADATPQATKGTVLDVPVSVSDGTNPPVTATVEVTVVASTEPLLSAVLDTAQIDAGDTEKIAVLENDSNPFPGGKRTVEDAGVINGTGEVSVEGDQVEVTPDADFHGVLSIQYSVLDDTQDPDRMATGEIHVTVRGTPDAPSAPRVGDVGDGFVELNVTAGDDNGAPITEYQVTSADGPAVSQTCASTSCTIDGLANDTKYTFEVVAINEVGTSDPSAPSAEARPDVRPEKPDSPSAERGDTQLTVSWNAPVNRGSAIQRYDLQMQNTSTGEIQSQELEAGSTSTTWQELTNGTDYRFRVRAHNLAEEPSEWSEWSRAEHPAGKPAAPAGTATASRINNPLGGGITVTWPEMTTAEANGEPITEYVVTSSSGASQTVPASKTKTTFQGLDENSKHSFTYQGVNSVGKGGSSGSSNAVVPWAKPAAPTGVKASLPGKDPNGKATVSWSAAKDHGTPVKDYVITWSGGGRAVVDASKTSYTASGLKNGKSYKFQVQARNRFEGGESALSKSSNSVTPYTKPDKPSISSNNEKCSGGSKCPVTFEISANGSDGGGGGKTLQYRVGGGSWQSTSKNSATVTKNIGSGKTVTAEARVKNGEGLVSKTVSDDQKAQSWQKTPKVQDITWGGKVPASESECSNDNCKWFRITLSGMAPKESYKVAFTNRKEGRYKTITMTAGSNGSARSAPKSNFYGYYDGGVPDNVPMSVEVKVNGSWKTIKEGVYTPY